MTQDTAERLLNEAYGWLIVGHFSSGNNAQTVTKLCDRIVEHLSAIESRETLADSLRRRGFAEIPEHLKTGQPSPPETQTSDAEMCLRRILQRLKAGKPLDDMLPVIERFAFQHASPLRETFAAPPPVEPTRAAELPEEPQSIKLMRIYDPIHPVLIDYDALRSLVERQITEKNQLAQSILDLSHPNMKMLREQVERQQETIRRLEKFRDPRYWVDQPDIQEAIIKKLNLVHAEAAERPSGEGK